MDGKKYVPLYKYCELYTENQQLKESLKKVSEDRDWWRQQADEFHKDYCALVEKLEEMKDRMDSIADRW